MFWRLDLQQKDRRGCFTLAQITLDHTNILSKMELTFGEFPNMPGNEWQGYVSIINQWCWSMVDNGYACENE